MKKLFGYIKILAELNKIKITFAVAITALAGYVLASKTINGSAFWSVFGIFILACGSASYNQFQEKDGDALMIRTQKRPIPSGRINPKLVVYISIFEIIVGTYLIYFGSNISAAMLGFMAFIWYNIIYTPLKKITAFAVIPGSIIGAIPPITGWVAAGGSVFDANLLVMASFFFMSQVPHFWLLMLHYGSDYKKAHFPVINDLLSETQIKRVTFVWIVATSVNIMFLVFSGLIVTIVFKVIIITAALSLIFVFSKLLYTSENNFKPIQYFVYLNIIFLIVIISMIIDPLL